jgi:hypothetical protein
MHPPAGVTKVPFEFADHTGHRVGHEWGAVVGVVAVSGHDEPGPGGLDEILGCRPTTGAVAAGEPVSQAQVGQDDLLPQLGIAADGVLLQPAINLGSGVQVAWADVNDRMVGGRGEGSGHRTPRGDWSSTRARWTGNMSS